MNQIAAVESPDGNAAPGDSSRKRWWQRTVGAAAVVAVLVIGGAGRAAASTPDTRSATTAGAESLHGEFAVINADRSVQTRHWQWGTVVAIDAISLTVRSTDGFSGHYLIGPGVSVTGITVGDDVTVVGAGQAVTTPV